MSPFPAKQAWTETDRKGFDANFEKFGNEEMAKFMEDYSGSEYEDEPQHVK
jgi:hypothetical protein